MQNQRWLKLCLIVMFILAALIRRDEIKAPGHLVEREYNSAIFARAFYFENNDKIPVWRVNNAVATREQFPLLEPPVTEYLVSIIYRLAGREEIWYARYLTSLFWLVGGVCMYEITRRLHSVGAAFIACAYYLFVPMGIIISRSFQPDALMMMMFLISLYCILLYYERPSKRWLLLAGFLAGITLLLRPLVLFSLLCAFGTLAAIGGLQSARLRIGRALLFGLIGLALPLAFYGYGIFIGKFLQGQAELSFRPYLLIRWEFWLGWFHNLVSVVGYSALAGAIFGSFFLGKRTARVFVLGLAIGYLIFGLVFTYHIHSHPYYQIQIFPLIAICLGAFLAKLVNDLVKPMGRKVWIPVTASLIFALYASYSAVRSTLYTPVFEDPKVAKEIGEVVAHNPHTVFIAYHYGVPLEYYGEFTGAPWPVSIDDSFYRRPGAKNLSVQARLKTLGFVPDFFIITNFRLYHEAHQDLQSYLNTNCSLFAQTNSYLVFDGCNDPSPDPN